MNQANLKVKFILIIVSSLLSYTAFASGYMNATNPKPSFVYKLFTPEQWEFVQKNSFSAEFCTKMDKRDGYLHLSTASQAAYIASKYFSNLEKGVLLQIDYSKIEDKIKWEASSKGELFPHAYGTIPEEAISKVYEFYFNNFDFGSLEK